MARDAEVCFIIWDIQGCLHGLRVDGATEWLAGLSEMLPPAQQRAVMHECMVHCRVQACIHHSLSSSLRIPESAVIACACASGCPWQLNTPASDAHSMLMGRLMLSGGLTCTIWCAAMLSDTKTG